MIDLLKAIQTVKSIDRYLLLLVAACVLVFASMQINGSPSRLPPPAVRGVSDLSSWDFASEGEAYLKGEWEFYPNQLLTPDDFAAGSPPPPIYVQVPKVWNGPAMKAWGAGTYRLRIQIRPTNELMAIKKTIVRFSDKLYINGKLIGQSGTPALTRDAYKPGNVPYTASFTPPESGRLELVMQVANFHFPSGGIYQPLSIGRSVDLLLARQVQVGLEWAGIIVLTVFALFFLTLFSLFKRNQGFLIFGLFFLIFAIIIFFNGERTFMQLFPNVPFELAWKIKDFSIFIIYPILGKYAHSFFRTRGYRLLIVLSGGWMLVYSLLVAVLPYRVYSQGVGVMYLSVPVPFILFDIALLAYYIRAKGNYGVFGKRELQLFIASFLGITLFILNTFMHQSNNYKSLLISDFLVLFFIAATILMLAHRYVHTYQSMVVLTQRLQEADQMKDEFLLRASHELNAPLHGIINLSQAAIDEPLSAAAARRKREKLRLIRNTAFRMSNIVSDVIDLTKIRDGRLDVELRRVDVQTCVVVLFEVFGFMAKEKGIALLNEVTEEARRLHVDENRLMQVMSNLLDHILRDLDRGSVSISSRAAGAFVRLRVAADGAAAAEADSSPDDSGVGIGLSVAKEIVRQMGGSLEAFRTEPGELQGFELLLPAWEEGEDEAPAANARARAVSERLAASMQAAAAVAEQAAAGAQGAYTILCVGELASLELTVNMLAIEGYRVDTAHNAAEALRRIGNPRSLPDLVMLDVMLPGGGFEVGRRIRQSYSPMDLPILYVTARNTPADVEAVLAAGGNDFVAKPLDAGEVRVRISSLLAMKRLAKEAAANEMAFLQSQIKPHFLYNALGTIMSLCYTDGPRAGELLAVFSRYLRIIFHQNHSDETVPLRKEMELVQAYADIEKARFGSRLQLRLDVDEQLLDYPVMPLTIQPLVENAIRHGVARRVDGGTVSLKIERLGDAARIVVEDDGVGMTETQVKELLMAGRQAEGVGFANIMKRVQNRTGKLPIVESALDRGTKVTIWLPLNEQEEMDA